MTPIFDPDGSVILNYDLATSRVTDGQRRLSRTATLDGGSYIFDGGFSHSDRTLEFSFPVINPVNLDTVLYMRNTYTEIICSVGKELFTGVIQRVQSGGQGATITYFVQERIAG